MSSPTEQRLGSALRDLVEDQPFTPDAAAITQRAHKSRRRARLTQSGIGVAVVAVAAVVAVGAANVTQPRAVSTPQAAATHPAKPTTSSMRQNTPLVNLAADVATQAQPTVGDATLIRRTEPTNPKYGGNSPGYGGYDLYTDDSHYYYGDTKADLAQATKEKEDETQGGYAREIQAALYAVNGDLTTARAQMAIAPLIPGKAGTLPADLVNNRVWDFGMDALVGGCANPQVRAGVLRLYSTLSDMTITNSTVDGQPVLVITTGASEMPGGDTGTLTLNADTGMPISYTSQEADNHGVDVVYQATRVNVADVAADRF